MRKKQTKITKLKKQLRNFMDTFNIHETMIRDIHGKKKHIETLEEQI